MRLVARPGGRLLRADVGQVDVRLAATGMAASRIVGEAGSIVRKILGANIYGVDDENIEEVVVQLLAAHEKNAGAGGIMHRLRIANPVDCLNVPGASAVFLGGAVSYSNAAKEKILDVQGGTLAAHGAVSEAVAREMAEGAREKFGADFAIAVTGIAGPGGGTAEKPVGTVFIALADAMGAVVERRLNIYERAVFKELTSNKLLEMLRKTAGFCRMTKIIQVR